MVKKDVPLTEVKARRNGQVPIFIIKNRASGQRWRVSGSNFLSACHRVGLEPDQVDASLVGFGNFSPGVMRYTGDDSDQLLDPPEDFANKKG